MDFSSIGFNRGNVLLLVLLVLSGVMITGFALSDLLIRDFQQSKRIDEGAAAFYSAESGIEDGLFKLRKTDAAMASLAGTSPLSNDSSYARSVSDEVPALIMSLDANDFVNMDLYDPDDASAGSDIDALRLAWEDTCGGCSWLEVGYTEWVPASGISWNENFVNQRYPITASPVVLSGLDSTKAYKIRITSHYGDVRNLNMTGYLNSAVVPIKHALVTMTSVGAYGRTEQTIQAVFTRQAPLQKIFDFVTFSECSIIKDGGAPVCP